MKSSEIGPNIACFWPLKFFGVRPPKILDGHYKIGPSTDHRAKFHARRPTHLGDLASGEKKMKKNITGKTQVLPKTIVYLYLAFLLNACVCMFSCLFPVCHNSLRVGTDDDYLHHVSVLAR